MFRKDFKLEMLAQDEESRKAELAEKQKALSGAKSGWKIWTGLSSTSMRTMCMGKLSDSRILKIIPR